MHCGSYDGCVCLKECEGKKGLISRQLMLGNRQEMVFFPAFFRRKK